MSPQARREQVALACQRGLSERRACGFVGLPRSCLGYELRLPAKDAPVIAAMKTLSSQSIRTGSITISRTAEAADGVEKVSPEVPTGQVAGPIEGSEEKVEQSV